MFDSPTLDPNECLSLAKKKTIPNNSTIYNLMKWFGNKHTLFSHIYSSRISHFGWKNQKWDSNPPHQWNNIKRISKIVCIRTFGFNLNQFWHIRIVTFNIHNRRMFAQTHDFGHMFLQWTLLKGSQNIFFFWFDMPYHLYNAPKTNMYAYVVRNLKPEIQIQMLNPQKALNNFFKLMNEKWKKKIGAKGASWANVQYEVWRNRTINQTKWLTNDHTLYYELIDAIWCCCMTMLSSSKITSHFSVFHYSAANLAVLVFSRPEKK